MPKQTGFQGMGLEKRVLRGVLGMYKQPTPVQRAVIPVALAGRDVVCMARTGAGKTAAFLIPVLSKVIQSEGAVGVVIAPTRELALQTLGFAKRMGKYCVMAAAAVVGGESLDSQFAAASAGNLRVMVATPGRLAHLVQVAPKLFPLERVACCVFDEADRLFEMGFAEDLRFLLSRMPEARQTMLFSATMPKLLVQFAKSLGEDVEVVRLDQEMRLSETLRVASFACRSVDKVAAVAALFRFVEAAALAIVFVATRHHCELVLHVLSHALGDRNVVGIYGAMDQEARTTNLDKFRKAEATVLVVTDVAARGLDVPLVDHVINFSFPPAPRLFVHRAGRAARQGRIGTAFSLVEPDELAYLCEVAEVVGVNLDEFGCVPRPVLDAASDLLPRTDEMDTLSRVASNATKAYKKTRRAPSGVALARAKTFFGNRTDRPHPLFGAGAGAGAGGVHAQQQQRLDIGSYRPPQTIFEMGQGSEAALKAHEQFRRKLRQSRRQQQQKQQQTVVAPPPVVPKQEEPAPVPEMTTKRRMSKAERKGRIAKPKVEAAPDKSHYIEYGSRDAMARETESAGKAQELLEAALLDVAPDDAVDVAKKKRLYKWDARKKKYVQRTLGELVEKKLSSSKRVRNEAGTKVAPQAAGDLYQKWREKQKKVRDSSSEDARNIAKKRKAADDKRLKNMPKAKRRAIEGKRRQAGRRRQEEVVGDNKKRRRRHP